MNAVGDRETQAARTGLAWTRTTQAFAVSDLLFLHAGLTQQRAMVWVLFGLGAAAVAQSAAIGTWRRRQLADQLSSAPQVVLGLTAALVVVITAVVAVSMG